MLNILAETNTHVAEYIGGYLFITNKSTGIDRLVRLENERGQCITRGQFKDACRTHGTDRAISTFLKLAANT